MCASSRKTVASLPLHVYQYTDTGSEKALEHPLYHILHDEPNTEMTSFVLRETMLTHLLLWATPIVKSCAMGADISSACNPLLPDQMTVDRDSGGKLTYDYMTRDSKLVRLRPEDVLHIPVWVSMV